MDARQDMVEFARHGGCLLMFASKSDQTIMFRRHERTFLRYNEVNTSHVKCGTFFSVNDAPHESSPWKEPGFQQQFTKFIKD